MAQKPRTPISGPRVIGNIVEWKGEFGWIEPAKPIAHPQASKRGGKIYLGVNDVVEEIEGVGATVSFTLYSDASGLGAADCKMAKGAVFAAKAGGAAAATDGKPATSSAVAQFKERAKKLQESKANGLASGKTAGLPASFTKPAAWKAGAAKAAAKAPTAKQVAAKAPVVTGSSAVKAAAELQRQLKAGVRSAPSAPASFQSAAKKAKTGGDFIAQAGERDILHEEPLLGTVVSWKGKFGWIKPHDTIEHPLADKHKGDIFLAVEDVEEEIEGVGAVVQFMLYGDGKGLGAANVKPPAE